MQLTDAARYLHVTAATVERWVRQGLLTPSASGGEPFTEAELARWPASAVSRTA